MLGNASGQKRSGTGQRIGRNLVSLAAAPEPNKLGDTRFDRHSCMF